ncbi:uncharacterized protein TNIN_64611, partial [Trichonephila inaurata madagascariensis]
PPPVSVKSVHPPPVSVKSVYPPPVSQKTVIPPPITQKTVKPLPVSQDHIDPGFSQSEILEPAYDASRDNSINIKTAPAGAKYVFVPSGPPYITDTHTTEIIHPPLPNNHGPALPPPAPISSHDPNPPLIIDHENSPPPSHAFRPPFPSDAPSYDSISSGPHGAPGIIDDGISPISHSTRLLIPSHGSTGGVGINHQDDIHSSPELPPVSHSIQLGPPSPHLTNSEISQPEHLVGNPVLPPVSHAFRLNLPLSPSHGPEPNGHSLNSGVSYLPEEEFDSPKLSHAFRLSLPSGPSDKSLPESHAEFFPFPGTDGSANSDIPLLALESKNDH